jgi:hypothetical protein
MFSTFAKRKKSKAPKFQTCLTCQHFRRGAGSSGNNNNMSPTFPIQIASVVTVSS